MSDDIQDYATENSGNKTHDGNQDADLQFIALGAFSSSLILGGQFLGNLLCTDLRQFFARVQNFRDQVLQIRQEILDARKELAEIGTKQIAQELATQNQAAAERAERDKLQIRVLIAIVSFVATILGGIILYIVTHLHP